MQPSPLRMWSSPAKGETLPWSWAEDRLRTAGTYWLCTAGEGGRPAARPVWGVWLEERLLLSVGSTTSWRNVGDGAPVTVHLGDVVEVVIVEGQARPETDLDVLGDLCDAYNAKYAWNFEVGSTGPILAVDPEVVIAWKTKPADQFDPRHLGPFPDAGGRWVPG